MQRQREQPLEPDSARVADSRASHGCNEAVRWMEPTAARDSAASETLSRAQVDSWRERGFALVDDVFPLALLERAREDALQIFPEAGSPESRSLTDFGSGGRLTFPATRASLNEITLHPRLLGAVAQLLAVEVRDLRLTQSDLWPKYGRDGPGKNVYDNDDQRIHVDYPNHTLVHPPRWDEPEAVELLLYLSDVDECGGATALVPRRGDSDPAYRYPIVDTPGVGALEWMNDRESSETYLREAAPEVARFRADQLYSREVHARYRLGTLLL